MGKIFQIPSYRLSFNCKTFRCIDLLLLEVIQMSALKGVLFCRHVEEEHNCNACYSNNTDYHILLLFRFPCHIFSGGSPVFQTVSDRNCLLSKWHDLQSELWRLFILL